MSIKEFNGVSQAASGATKDLIDHMLGEIEYFFVNYNEEKGKKFKVLERKGPQQAMKLLKKSVIDCLPARRDIIGIKAGVEKRLRRTQF